MILRKAFQIILFPKVFKAFKTHFSVDFSLAFNFSCLSEKFALAKLQCKMFEFLETLKEGGKKLFMLTNSPFYFVDGGMRFMLEVLFKY